MGIISMFPSGGGSVGISLDVISGSSLPSVVVNDQIYIITSTTPGTIYVDTDTPSNPASGDAWVVAAEGGAGAITFTERIYFDGAIALNVSQGNGNITIYELEAATNKY